MLSANGWAFQPLVTDDTGTQGEGGNQVEVAYNRTLDRAPGSRITTHAVPLVYARGITNALDLYFGLVSQKIIPDLPAAAESGWGNTAIGAKWRFYENDTSKLSFAFKPEMRLPVSGNREARGLGMARTSYGVGLMMTQETGFGAVHANLVVNRANYSDAVLNAAERRTTHILSVATVWDVTTKWKLALDAGLVTNPDRVANARMGYVEVGAVYSPDSNLDLAIGVMRNVMDGGANTLQAITGLTWRFR